MQYPTNTRTIRVLCTGQVDTTFLLKALRNGADGVLVVGCRRSECHYLTGNLQAFEKVELAKQLIKRAGFDPERIEMRFISSAEGNRYVQAVKEFTATVLKLGPSPLSSPEAAAPLKRMLDGLIAAAGEYRIRAIIAKKLMMIEEGNVYQQKLSKEEMEELIADTINAEYIRQSILACLKQKQHSCTELAEMIAIPPHRVLSELSNLRRKNLVDVEKVQERVPYYRRI
jgi:F420-non-reducing hydrogenase iron-sulfur subunit